MVGFFLVAGVLSGTLFTGILESTKEQWILLGYWCVIGFVSCNIVLYDIIYQEVQDKVLLPGILFVWICGIFGLPNILSSAGGGDIFFIENNWKEMLIGGAIWYFFLFLFILIPASIYSIRQKKYNIFKELLVLFFFLFPLVIQDLLQKKPPEESEDEIPVWVGIGDLRIGVFIGGILGSFGTLMSMFWTYTLGSIIAIALLIIRKRGGKVAFGPFMILGLYGTILFTKIVLPWIQNILL